VVVIATDSIEGDPEDRWASEVVRALRPDAAWLIVDATRKIDDERARLDRIGGIDALAVYSARLSSSPATAWDLGLPIALLDGRPATTFAWSSLLFSALPTHTRHEATA
ncbi:MAG: pclO, partial [Frankiales bacterium]|nr:pclO [Frankiales bacterium]